MSTTKTPSVAIVTGASKGIGRAVAVELARRGFFLIVNYRSDETGAVETLNQVRKRGSDGELAPFDVTDAKAVSAAMDQILNRYTHIDVLVNNAGIIADTLFVMMSPDEWHSVINTGLNGFYNVTRPVVERMLANKRGAIVSIASVSALVGNRGQTNYSAAKGGLIAASRALAAETARLGVRVNVVAPGLIGTDMTRDLPLKNIKAMIPMARIGRPEEVAQAVGFLCSDAASYITSQVLSVNGGMF